MGMPLKVSDSLVSVARHEAEAAQRSITAQVEHWARIGRAVEIVLAHNELLALKKAGELLTPAYPSATRRRHVHKLLTQIAASADREAVLARIRSARTPLYTTDPQAPGMIVQVTPDGRRTVGRLEGRRFVPASKKSGKRAG